MTTIQINIPDEVFRLMDSVSGAKEEFVLEAIQEKFDREKRNRLTGLLIEGYQATFEEDFALTKEFEKSDFEYK